MSRESEKFFKGFAEYSKGLSFKTEEELESAIQDYMQKYNAGIAGLNGMEAPVSADDYLEMAENADTQKEALKYAKKALSIESDNIDAQTAVAIHSAATVQDTIAKLAAVYESATAQITLQGLLCDENVGEFWLIHETRPYMRLLNLYSSALYDAGMMKSAAEILREMLRLCNNDNLGARYTLMHILAYFEDAESAQELVNKYPNDNSGMMLMPLALLYYKLGDLKKSAAYLRKLRSTNKDAVRFLTGIINGDLELTDEETNPYGYRPFTIEELVEIFQTHRILYFGNPAFLEWASIKIKSNTRKKK